MHLQSRVPRYIIWRILGLYHQTPLFSCLCISMLTPNFSGNTKKYVFYDVSMLYPPGNLYPGLILLLDVGFNVSVRLYTSMDCKQENHINQCIGKWYLIYSYVSNYSLIYRKSTVWDCILLFTIINDSIRTKMKDQQPRNTTTDPYNRSLMIL